MNKFILQRNELLSKKLITSLEKRNFKAYFCNNKQETNKLLLDLISKNENLIKE